MKIYVATTINNAPMAEELAKSLEVRGHQITYKWWEHGFVHDAARQMAIAVDEIRGVTSADLLIALLPGGRGTHCELGAALASGIPIILHPYQPLEDELGRIPCFYRHPHVKMESDYFKIYDWVAKVAGDDDA